MVNSNKIQTAMKRKSALMLYLRTNRKRQMDESNNEDMLLFIHIALSKFFTMLYCISRYYLPNRTMWLHSHQQTFWEEIVKGEWLMNPSLLDERYLKEFRMTYKQFNKLIEMVILFIKKQDTNWRNAIPVDKVVAIVLHRLGHRGSLCVGGNYLGVSAVVTSKFTHNLCKILVMEFHDRYIHIPEGEAL